MASNKLYTLSYFRKRLAEEGFASKVIIDKFPVDDKRYWMISIDRNNMIICTCFKYTDNGNTTYHFQFTDGGQRLKFTVTKQTESMAVITTYLKELLQKEHT